MSRFDVEGLRLGLQDLWSWGHYSGIRSQEKV